MTVPHSQDLNATERAWTKAEIGAQHAALLTSLKQLDLFLPLSLYVATSATTSQTAPNAVERRSSGNFYGTAGDDIFDATGGSAVIMPGGGRDVITLGNDVYNLIYYEGRWELYRDDLDEIHHFDPTKAKITLYDMEIDAPGTDPDKKTLTVREATEFSGEAREWIINKLGLTQWEAYYNFAGRRVDTSLPTRENADVRLAIHTTGGDVTADNFAIYYPPVVPSTTDQLL